MSAMVESQSMVERVARAICAADGRFDPDAVAFGSPCWDRYVDHARAAMAAMRDAPPDVIAAGQKDANFGWSFPVAWNSALDAALTEPERTEAGHG